MLRGGGGEVMGGGLWIWGVWVCTCWAHKKGSIIALNASGVKEKQLYTCNNLFTEKVTTMTFFRNRMFLQGIALGGLFGIIIGSIIAFTIGESGVEAIRRGIHHRCPNPHEAPFKYLSQ